VCDSVALVLGRRAEPRKDHVGTLGKRTNTLSSLAELMQRTRQRPHRQGMIRLIGDIITELPQGALEHRNRSNELPLRREDLPSHGEQPCLDLAFARRAAREDALGLEDMGHRFVVTFEGEQCLRDVHLG